MAKCGNSGAKWKGHEQKWKEMEVVRGIEMEKSVTGYETLEKCFVKRWLEPDLTATVSEIESRSRTIRIGVWLWEMIYIHF